MGYQNEQRAKKKVANVADDVVQGGDGECARDSPGMATQWVVVTDVLVSTDV